MILANAWSLQMPTTAIMVTHFKHCSGSLVRGEGQGSVDPLLGVEVARLQSDCLKICSFICFSSSFGLSQLAVLAELAKLRVLALTLAEEFVVYGGC